MLQRAGGYVLIVVGAAGLILPVIPGIPLLLIGMRLLGPDHWITRPVVGALRKVRSR